jgi:sugar (pentulose or hexulose) kinase
VAASEVTSLGAHSDLWAPAQGRLSSLAGQCGWGHLIPPLRRAWDALGPIRPEIAAATGLDPATAVLTGIHDSNASLLPHLGAGAAPFAMVSSGTWVIILHAGGDLAALDPAADMLAGVDALGRPVPSARFMGGREYAAIAGDDAPPDLDAARAVIASGALALPAFSEQGGPWRGRPGRIEGALPDRPGARSALASLYAALVTDELLSRLGVTGAVIVDGPFAANPVWCAALAELRSEPGVLVSDAASAAAGAALLAAWPEVPAPRSRPAPPAVPPLGMPAYRACWRGALAR